MSFETPALPPPAQGTGGNATIALVLGIVGLVGSLLSCCCCIFALLGVCAPIGWYVGHRELAAIRAGLSPASGEGPARAGMICGIIGTVLMVLYVLGMVVYVVLVGFGAALEGMKHGGMPQLTR